MSGESGDEFRERRLALGLSKTELAERAGVDRSRINKAEAGDPTVRDSILGAIDRALTDLEREFGMDLPSQVEPPRGVVESEHGGVVRIRLEGVFGADAAIVEAPADNPDALAAALDIIMRRMGEKGSEGSEGTAEPRP